MLSSDIQINRQAFPWGRAYIVEGAGKAPLILPSVTTVLKLVKNEKYEKLRIEFGEKRWDKIMHDAAERGTIMHTMLELFLLEWAKDKNVDRSLKKAQIYAIEESRKEDGKYLGYVNKGRDLFWNFYHDKFWENISEIVDNEVFLYITFKGGWAGACDFVYRDLEHNLIVEDFKSSTSFKEEDDIFGYKLQISAYMFMCAEKYGEVPKMGKIRVSNEQSSEIQTFIVHDYELKHYLSHFIELAKEFRKINEIPETYLNPNV
jgi:hypothetical protein